MGGIIVGVVFCGLLLCCGMNENCRPTIHPEKQAEPREEGEWEINFFNINDINEINFVWIGKIREEGCVSRPLQRSHLLQSNQYSY